jgi:hypothetical protein
MIWATWTPTKKKKKKKKKTRVNLAAGEGFYIEIMKYKMHIKVYHNYIEFNLIMMGKNYTYVTTCSPPEV